MNFVLFGQGGYYNRGCEAIIRTVTTMLRKTFPDCKVYTAAYDYKGDRNAKYGIVDKIYPHVNVRYSPPHILAYLNRRLGREERDIKWQYKWLEKLLGFGDVFISVGGDNYCYEEPTPFYHMDKMIKAAGKKLIFWGASFDESLITDNMNEDLKLFDAIIVRESLSYESLKKIGIKNVFLHPDPAFMMGVTQSKLPEWWKKGDTIGLNLSPLSIRYSNDSDIIFDGICKLIEHILSGTTSSIALIPHVVDDKQSSTQFDTGALMPLYEKFHSSNRVFMIDHSQYNAKELKGFISRCRMFIGARTHSTIAAYSTGVPTLAIGYSIKAKGIAKDVFGTLENRIVNISIVKNADDFIKPFDEIIKDEKDIRMSLSKYMGPYKQSAQKAVDQIKDIINAED